MRVHRLEVQAFGPFADRQVVDFDRLTEQGLFLLNGATGAGKTSVLDAICFALYGSVPGVRQEGRRLRSDHALADLEPLVLLEFSVADRQFLVERSPSWQRPAKRGTSTVTEQARTLLQERVGGSWRAMTSRNQEAGGEISALLGMSREQFTKVVMLAQGEFAAFLRAHVKERQELLQKLFGTDRFQAIEERLAASSATLRGELAEQEAALAKILQDGCEQLQSFRAELTPPKTSMDQAAVDAESTAEGQAPGGADDAAAGQQPSFAGLLRLAEQLQVEQLLALKEAESWQNNVKEKVDLAQQLNQRHRALAEAETAKNTVQANRPQQLIEQKMLEDHRLAEGFSSELNRLQLAEQAQLAAETALAQARSQLPELFFGGESSDWQQAARDAASQAAVVEALLPEQLLLDADRAKAQKYSAELRGLRQRAEQIAMELSELSTERDSALQNRERLEKVAAQLELRRRQLADSTAKLAAFEEHRKLLAQFQLADGGLQQAKVDQLEAKERWLKLLEARLEHAAAELARGLVPGQPCPVCGSLEHPQPMHEAGSGESLSDAEKQAQRLHEDRQRTTELLTEKHSALRAALAGLAAQGGAEELSGLKELQQKNLAQHQQANQAATTREDLLKRLETLASRISELQSDGQTVEHRSQELSTELASAETKIAERQSRIGYHLQQDASLQAKLDRLARQEKQLLEAVAANSTLLQADQELHTALGLLEEKLKGSIFASSDEIGRALRSSIELDRLQQSLLHFQEAAVRADQAWATAEVQRALQERVVEGVQAPSDEFLAELAASNFAASQQAKTAALQSALADQLVSRLTFAAQRYLDLEQKITPLREHSQLLSGLADTARGLGHNDYRMPLSAYVLAARLEQVAAAATERLLTMSDGRYSLEYSDALAGRSRKSGLGLEVIDGWTDQRRDTATLSGGESFMASLALALGLADVVQQESGGLHIETLFVDEGFGGLDEEALDQVMTSLENLRDSGRVVGLVSHVNEMKLRIPLQLQVDKGRTGSTLKTKVLDEAQLG